MTDNPLAHKIVVLEPDAPTRLRLEAELRNAGYEVIALAASEDALDAINQLGSCIVIADYHAPNISGLELCATIRELCELQALGLVYAVLLTSDPDYKLIVNGLESGADEVIAKPYHTEELFARLRVGTRVLRLQEEVTRRQMEIHKANAEMAILNRRLEKLAHTDSLTGLANRRSVLERLHDQWALAERLNHPLSVIMIDVDHFKQINDTCGHKSGDEVLCEIANTIRRTTRRYDICGRFGGEEFIIVCPETPVVHAALVAERLRAEVAQLRIQVSGREITPTVSAGVAPRLQRTSSAEDLIHAADEQLYSAKRNGRNRVWLCDESEPGRHFREESAAELL
jgi:diguanylate cyclase (GGDEF)-like protein